MVKEFKRYKIIKTIIETFILKDEVVAESEEKALENVQFNSCSNKKTLNATETIKAVEMTEADI